MTTTALNLSSISKTFNGQCVVDDLSFELSRGDIGCLLGESGCGKTTLLRCIAGFETIQSGTIRIDGSVVSSPTHHVAPERRRVGMVFQEYALFPHLTVKGNIKFGLIHMTTEKKKRRVAEMLDLVGLKGEEEKYPHELSGGQQQRVALARALAPNPNLLLMDEPFSNLDVGLRERLCIDVRTIIKEIGISALLVTHNQQEAFAMADIVGVMQKGSLEQWDTAYNLYHRPKTRFVADFVGEGVLIKGHVTGHDEVKTALGTLKGRFSYPCRNGCPADVLIRPEDIVHDDNSAFTATIVQKKFRGPNILYSLKLENHEEIMALVSSHQDHALNQTIGIKSQINEIILFVDGSRQDQIL